MTNQNPQPQTLDEIFAAGAVALAAEKEEQAKNKREISAYYAAIDAAILTAAARYIPAPLHPFLSAKRWEDEEKAIITINAPDCWPVCFEIYEKRDDDLSEPGNWTKSDWKNVKPVYLDGLAYPRFDFSDLPLAMATAKEKGPQPAPAPKVEKPKTKSEYEIMRDQLSLALSDFENGGVKSAQFTVSHVTASALVDLAESLDWISNNANQFATSIY